MRTLKDNYYIITGHTYDEYIQKYHHGVGKGKLLIFKENELKYLKKRKFYWEVIGPDGNILYCQVHRVKKQHVLIPLLVAVLAGGGTTAGVMFLPKLFQKEQEEKEFDGKVTKDEFFEGIENICSINQNKKTLDYQATSVDGVEVGDKKHTIKLDNLVVKKSLKEGSAYECDEYETAYILNTGETHEFCRYQNIPMEKNLSSAGSTPSVCNCLIHDYFDIIGFNAFYNYNNIKFDSNNKTYTLTECPLPLEKFNCSFKFNKEKKLDTLTFDYKYYGTGTYAKGTFNFKDGKGTYSGPWTDQEKQAARTNHFFGTNEMRFDESGQYWYTNDSLVQTKGSTHATFTIDYQKASVTTGQIEPKRIELYNKSTNTPIYDWQSSCEIYIMHPGSNGWEKFMLVSDSSLSQDFDRYSIGSHNQELKCIDLAYKSSLANNDQIRIKISVPNSLITDENIAIKIS